MALKLSLVIKAVDQATAPIRRITSAATGLARNGLRRLTGEGSTASRALDRIRSIAARVPAPLGRAASAATRFAGRAGLRAVERASYAAGYAIGFTIRQAAKFGLTMAKWGGGAAIAGAGAFVGSIIPLASKFEQFQVILENTEGSAARARNAMAWVKEFGKTTPYEVEEVMEAFVKLKAYGIDPMDGTLTSLGNAASGMGKQLLQAIEMIADAQTGEFERTKEFGIKAKVAGDKVTFAYTKNGKEMSRSAKNSATEIRKALTGIFDEKFAGMMDRQSRTLSGIWSNLKDQIAGFQLDVADAGFFDFVKTQLTSVLDRVQQLAADGTLQRWAEQLSKWLVQAGQDAGKFFNEQDWKAHGETLLGVGRAVWFVARAVGGLANAIASAGGGIISFFKEWNALNNRAGQAIGVPKGGVFAKPEGQPFQPSRGGRLPNSATGGRAPGVAWPSRGPMKPGAPRQSLAWPRQGARPAESNVNLMIKTQPGTTASVTGMKTSPGTNLNVSRGNLGMLA